MAPNTRATSQASNMPREREPGNSNQAGDDNNNTYPSREEDIYMIREERTPSQSTIASTEEPEDLATMPLEELRQRAEQVEILRKRAEYIAIIQGETTLPFRKHDRMHSYTQRDPPPKRQLLTRLPTKEEQYHTTTYASYCEFTRRIHAFGEGNHYTDEDRVNLAVLYFDSNLQGLWAREVSITQSRTWNALCQFLLRQLGDPADRLHVAWSKALRMRQDEGESDFAYLQRWQEQWSELGHEGQDHETIILRLFFDSFSPAIKQKIREQNEFPKNPADLASLITKLRPSIQTQASRSQSTQNTKSANQGNHPNQQNSSSRSTQGRGGSSQTQRNRGHIGNYQIRKPDQNKNKRSGPVCYYCEEPGHVKPDCPKLAKDKGKEQA